MSVVYKVYQKIETDSIFVFIVLGLILSFTIVNDLALIVHPIVYYDVNRVTVPFLEKCTISSLPDMREPLRWYTVCLSDHVFGYSQLLPSLFSLSLIPIIFYYSKALTKSNTVSILATLITSLSTTFVNYAFSDTYPQFWVALLFGSLYLASTKKFAYFAVAPFAIGIFYHGLVLLDFPLIVYQLYKSQTGKRRNLSIISILIPAVLLLGYTLLGGTSISNNGMIQNNISLKTITQELTTFRFDIPLYLSLPLLLPLLYKSKKYGMLFSISYLILQVFALGLFTNLGQEPYRLLPILVFMAIGFSDLYVRSILKYYSTIKPNK